MTLNEVGIIDPKPKTITLKRYDARKDKHISQLNGHEDELEEFHVQDQLATINMQSNPFSNFPDIFG